MQFQVAQFFYCSVVQTPDVVSDKLEKCREFPCPPEARFFVVRPMQLLARLPLLLMGFEVAKNKQIKAILIPVRFLTL